ncbi:MAG: ketoacyl-ACP synthase III [Planctomycetes bacterium]|nr:ketoacyl-ACP synthase III [Planctomycetota bacterium]
MTTFIKGVSHFTPDTVLTNADLETMVDTTDEWIVTRTGIRSRTIARDGLEVSDMACRASEKALRMAGMGPKELDGILVATCTPDMTMPGASSLLQHKLGAGEILAMDLNAACSGFVYGMDAADGLLSSGRYTHVLLACSEKFSSILNYKDRSTCILFGDGAGSLILSRESGFARIASIYTGGNGALANLLKRPAGGSAVPPHHCNRPEDLFVQMEGGEVFKHAVRGFNASAEKTLARAGWAFSDVDWLVPHQANQRLIQSAVDRLGIDPSRVVVNIGKYGNMSAASIPVAMSEAMHKFRPGDKVLCLAFGAGFTWGGVAIEWTGEPNCNA